MFSESDRTGLSNGSVLDLGTGPLTQAIALAERGFQVIAIDLSETAIHQAAAKANQKGLEVSFRQDDNHLANMIPIVCIGIA